MKALEADLFCSEDWAVELLEPLVGLAEATAQSLAGDTGAAAEVEYERTLLAWRLAVNRARVEAGRNDAGERAPTPAPAPAPVSSGAPDPASDPLARARDALLSLGGGAAFATAADAFTQAYEDYGGTLVDALLSALARSNVLRRDHARAAELFETVGEECERRARGGNPGWRETARSCWFRATVAHRLAGNENAAAQAKAAADRLGGPGVPPAAFGIRGVRKSHGDTRGSPPDATP